MASGSMAAVFREEVATVLRGFEFAAAPVTFEPGGEINISYRSSLEIVASFVCRF